MRWTDMSETVTIDASGVSEFIAKVIPEAILDIFKNYDSKYYW